MAAIGEWNALEIVRGTAHGFYLDGAEHGDILLPNKYVPPGAAIGDIVRVFVYRDSEDLPIATTETPAATVGQFAVLRVVSVNPQVGAFLDWGIPKDLLLPFAEQVAPVRTGDRAAIYVDLDQKTDRIYATTKLERHLSHEPPAYEPGQAVDVVIARETPLGYVALVENAHLGLLYRSNLGVPLPIGHGMKAYVETVRSDGKIDLRADPAGYQRIGTLTDKIMAALETGGGCLALDDDSPPTEIRATFGCSKKAFKQALGALFRKRAIEFTKHGIRRVDARPK